MRWRVLFTKIPGPLLHEINSSHKTSLEALREGGSHELEWITWVEWLGGKGGGAIGKVAVSGEERESQTDTEKCTHRETDIDKHARREVCESEQLPWSLLKEGWVIGNFRMCNVLFKLIYSSFKKTKYKDLDSLSRLLRSDVCCPGWCISRQRLVSRPPRYIWVSFRI